MTNVQRYQRLVPRRTRLSVVLRGAQTVRDGSRVTVRLASGRTVDGYARKLEDGSVRVELPDGVS